MRLPNVVRSPRFWVLAIAAVHLLVSLVVVADPLTGHDEGLLMAGFSKGLAATFWATLFFQKAKPALALLYLPFAPLGFGAYLVAHAVVGAAGVAMVGEAALRLGHRRPYLPALVMAMSPLYSWSVLVGVSSSDGVVMVVLSLLLLSLERPLLAAAVLGVAPWVRYECAAFSALFGLYLLGSRRDLRLVAAMGAFPLVYAAGGAVFHRDALWFLHFLPGVSGTSGIEAWADTFARHNVATLAMTFSLLTPLLALLALLRPSKLRSLDRALAAFCAMFLGLFAFTHTVPRDLGPVFVLGFSSRYALMALPAAALLVGRVVEHVEDEAGLGLRDTVAAAALLGAGVFARLRGADAGLLWGAASAGAVAGAMRAGAPGLAVTAAVALVAAGPPALQSDHGREFAVKTPWVEQVVDLIERRGPRDRADVYTNTSLLSLYAQRSERLPGRRVRFMLAADMDLELTVLTNPANGQRDAIRSRLPRAIFGDVVVPDDLEPSKVAAGTIFVLRDDVRTKLILPPEVWAPRLREIGNLGRVRVLVHEP